ncbi:MAG TPA: hypothetical protein VFW05_14390 [Verrucomicrobiae bacterium]|nr:hypothetical protein [Verrucomicrobiae bacterium]
MAGTGIDSKLRLSLREGSIYYFTDRSLTSPEPHYFIVANADPIAQKLLLLSVLTSQVDSVKLRRKKCPETLVELSPKECTVFKKLSIVDCNDLKEVTLAEFNARFVRQEIRCFGQDLPAPLRRALRKAIYASSIVSGEMKAFIGKP